MDTDITYLQMVTFKMENDFTKKVDDLIKERLKDHGFDCNDTEFIKNNFQFIQDEGSGWKRLYYKYQTVDEKLIIAFELYPEFNPLILNTEDKINCKLECKYY